MNAILTERPVTDDGLPAYNDDGSPVGSASTPETVTFDGGGENDLEGTVWVVAANYVDDPHPHVIAVYDNERAANEHETKIRMGGWSYDGRDVAALVVREKIVRSEVP